MNCGPRSVVSVDGVPKRETQVWTKARATVSAVLSVMGTAFGQQVKHLTQVKHSTHGEQVCKTGERIN